MLDILYQDDAVIVINKPASWLVHRSWLDRKEKVVVMQTLRDQIGQHVFPVHRLDRPTSGALLLGLNSDIARQLSQQFEQHQVHKIYHAIVRGYLLDAGEVDYPLQERLDKIADKFANQDKPPQEAFTRYSPLKHSEIPVAIGRYASSRYSLLELEPLTGRKHQLRRHLSHLSHPIIGDTTYGDLRHNRNFAQHFCVSRLLLHAYQLTFIHPLTNVLCKVTAPYDEHWLSAMEQLGWR